MLSTFNQRADMRLPLFLLAIRPELGGVIDIQQLHQSPHLFWITHYIIIIWIHTFSKWYHWQWHHVLPAVWLSSKGHAVFVHAPPPQDVQAWQLTNWHHCVNIVSRCVKYFGCLWVRSAKEPSVSHWPDKCAGCDRCGTKRLLWLVQCWVDTSQKPGVTWLGSDQRHRRCSCFSSL